ncbi:MAG: K(+)-transporting ATPase subunit F [Bryobacteraceae bacterium]|nr:K(+)-transporting ATPase subunit F [Bryobacteraceae bacterium]
MSPQYVICGLIAVGILVYLIVALLKPEIFS